MADRYGVKPVKGRTNKFVAYNTRTGNVISKPVSKRLAEDIATAVANYKAASMAKHLDMSGLDADMADVKLPKVYVYNFMGMDEAVGMWDEGVRDLDTEDLTAPNVLGVASTALGAAELAVRDTLVHVRENEKELLESEDDGEMLPGILEERLETIMQAMRWQDLKDRPIDMLNPVLAKRLSEYGDDKGQPYGRPRLTAYLCQPSTSKPDEWNLVATVVIEELVLDEGVTR